MEHRANLVSRERSVPQCSGRPLTRLRASLESEAPTAWPQSNFTTPAHELSSNTDELPSKANELVSKGHTNCRPASHGVRIRGAPLDSGTRARALAGASGDDNRDLALAGTQDAFGLVLAG